MIICDTGCFHYCIVSRASLIALHLHTLSLSVFILLWARCVSKEYTFLSNGQLISCAYITINSRVLYVCRDLMVQTIEGWPTSTMQVCITLTIIKIL